MPCGSEGNRRSDVALAMRHKTSVVYRPTGSRPKAGIFLLRDISASSALKTLNDNAIMRYANPRTHSIEGHVNDTIGTVLVP